MCEEPQTWDAQATPCVVCALYTRPQQWCVGGMAGGTRAQAELAPLSSFTPPAGGLRGGARGEQPPELPDGYRGLD
jgi:hypothetical protein